MRILIGQVIVAIIVSFPWCSVCLAQDHIDKYLPDDAIARFGKGYAFDFAYSPDGQKIAVASTIGVWLYDTDTKLEKNFLTGHKGYVKEIVFNPNGSTFVSIGGGVLNSPYDPVEAKLWNLKSEELISYLIEVTDPPDESEISSVVFSPDGKTVAIALYDSTIRLFDGITGEPKSTIKGHDYQVLMFSPDSKTLVGGSGEMIRLLNVATGELQTEFAAHANSVKTINYSADAKTIISHGEDSNVIIWDAETGAFLSIYKSNMKEISSVDYSKDGKSLVVLGSDNTIILWNTHTGEKTQTINNELELYDVHFSPNGTTFACDADNGTMLLFEAATGTLLHQFKMPGVSNYVSDFKYSPDSKTLVVYDGSEIFFWDLNSFEIHSTITDYSDVVGDAIFGPNDKILVSVDDIVRIWDIEENKLQRKIEAQGNAISIALSSDGKNLAIGTSDDTILLWDAVNWKHSMTLEGHTNTVFLVVFSPNGKVVASASYEDTIRIWDVQTGDLQYTFNADISDSRKLLFSPDGRYLMGIVKVEGVTKICTWDIEDGELITSTDTEIDVDEYPSMDFSHDGLTIVTTDDQFNINFWNVATGKRIDIFIPNAKGYDVAFSPDNKTVALEFSDKISLWDIETGELRKTLEGHISALNSIVFSSDGTKLVSSCRDSTVILWDITD